MFDIGDLIFQSLKEEAPFNQAVSHSGQQTPTESMISGINHVGIYIGQNVVIDSTPKEGVIEQTLHDFLASGQRHIVASVNDSTVAYRAVQRVKTCLGAQYNHSFYPNDSGFYCSELVTYAFKTEHNEDYFEQYPMNFNHVTTKTLLPFWHHYYQSLQRAVPQGMMGSHPQQLLRQHHLFRSLRPWI